MIRTEQMDGGIWYWDKAGFILITVEVQLIEPKLVKLLDGGENG